MGRAFFSTDRPDLVGRLSSCALCAIEQVEPISGELALQLNLPGDSLRQGQIPTKIMHRPELSGGGINTVVRGEQAVPGQIKVHATVGAGDCRACLRSVTRKVAWAPERELWRGYEELFLPT